MLTTARIFLRARFFLFRMRSVLGLIGILLALAGCGGSTANSANSSGAPVTNPPAASPSTVAVASSPSPAAATTGTVNLVIQNDAATKQTRAYPVGTTQVRITILHGGAQVGTPIVTALPAAGASTTVTIANVPFGPCQARIEALNGNGTVIGGVTINFTVDGSSTSVPVSFSPSLVITPTDQTVAIGQRIAFSASGGAGGYSWSLATNASGASIDASSGQYTAGNVSGSVDVVQVTDSLHNTLTTRVAVGLTLTPSAITVDAGASQTFTARGGIAPFTFKLSTNNSHATLVAATDSATYTAGGLGNVSDVVIVTDATNHAATAAITVRSTLRLQTGTTTLLQRATFQLVALGGVAPYGYRVTSANPLGTVSSSGLYTAGSVNGTETVTVTDSAGNATTATIVISPVQISGNGTAITTALAVDGPAANVQMTASGVQSPVTWSLSQNPSGGAINATTGLYVAGPLLPGTASDVVTVTDPLGNTASVSLNVGTTPVLRASVKNQTLTGPTASPVAVPGPAATLTFTATRGLPPYTWSLLTQGSGTPTINNSGVYVAGQTPNSTDTMRLQDSLGNTLDVTVTVGPSLTLTDVPAVAQPSPSLLIPSNLPSSAALTLFAGGGTGNYTFGFNTNNSGATLTPTADPAYVTYRSGTTAGVADVVSVSDGNTTATYSINVQGATLSITTPRGPLVGNPHPYGAKFGTPVTLIAAGGSGLYSTWTPAVSQSGGSLQNFGGNLAGYLPGMNFGTDTITLTDSLGNTASIDVTVYPGPIPFPIPGQTASKSGAPLRVTLASTDALNDPVAYTAQADVGQVNTSGNTLTVNVSTLPVGTVFKVTVTATDAHGLTNTTSFLVTVTA